MRHARSDYNRFQDPEGKIPDNEPVFLIRGQDLAGAFAVEAYANLAEAIGADAMLVDACRRHARLMRVWSAEHGGKIPDAPAEALSG